MSKHKDISDEDKILFHQAIGDVKPLKQTHCEIDKPKVEPVPRQQHLDDQAVIRSLLSELSESDVLETGEHISYRKNGVQQAVLRKLKRGGFSIQAELDLHGFTAKQAQQEVQAFLRHCAAHDIRCVRVIHGKGRKTAEQAPILKPMLNHLLQQRNDVIAFCSARAHDGGTGAVYVLLKRDSLR